MATVLAVVPACERGQAFDELAGEFPGHEILVVETAHDGVSKVGPRIPDLVLFPLTLSAVEQRALRARLRQWDEGNGRGTAVSLPASTTLGSKTIDCRWFYWLRPVTKLRVEPRSDGPARAGGEASQPWPELAVACEVATPMAPVTAPARPPHLDAARAWIRAVSRILRFARTFAAPARVGAAWTWSFLRLAGSILVARASAFRVDAVGGLQVARAGALRAVHRGALTAWSAVRGMPRPGRSCAAVGAASLKAARWGVLKALSPLRSVALSGASWVTRGAGSVWAARARALRFVTAALVITGAVVLASGATRILSQTTRPRSSTLGQGAPMRGTDVQGAEAKRTPTGRLHVTSDPPRAAVLVDGHRIGFTPLLLDDLTPGQHVVTLEQAAGSVRRVVRVKANETAELNAPIDSSWLALSAPFELEIWDSGQALNLDERNRVRLSLGPHELQFANRALGYRGSRAVVVQPGKVTVVSITSPKAAVTVTASAPADVWINGVRIGQTPIVDQQIDIGTREFVLRNAAFGERHITATVTTKPFRINVDFTKPDP